MQKSARNYRCGREIQGRRTERKDCRGRGLQGSMEIPDLAVDENLEVEKA